VYSTENLAKTGLVDAEVTGLTEIVEKQTNENRATEEHLACHVHHSNSKSSPVTKAGFITAAAAGLH